MIKKIIFSLYLIFDQSDQLLFLFNELLFNNNLLVQPLYDLGSTVSEGYANSTEISTISFNEIGHHAEDLRTQARSLRTLLIDHNHNNSKPQEIVKVMQTVREHLGSLSELIIRDPKLFNNPWAYNALEQASVLERDASPYRVHEIFKSCNTPTGRGQILDVVSTTANRCDTLAKYISIFFPK